MTSPPSGYPTPLLQGMAEAALAAGHAVLEIYARDDLGRATKGDGSPVTAADHAAEAVILQALQRLAPDVPVVAEEEAAAGRIPATDGRFFLVDPLDGTKEFLSRNGEFTVNIGLIEDEAPVAGVVYAPALGEIFIGERGGARVAPVVEGRRQGWRSITSGHGGASGLRAVASRSHMGPETQAYLASLRVAELVSAGSSLKFCRVAQGRADVYPRLGRTMEWDTAAGDAVLRAAGGLVSTLDGAPLAYGKRGRAGEADFANPWFVATGALDLETYRRAAAPPD